MLSQLCRNRRHNIVHCCPFLRLKLLRRLHNLPQHGRFILLLQHLSLTSSHYPNLLILAQHVSSTALHQPLILRKTTLPKHFTVPHQKPLNLASHNYHIRQYLCLRTHEHDEQIFVAKEPKGGIGKHPDVDTRCDPKVREEVRAQERRRVLAYQG